jgi:hypothetical protein
MSFRPNATTVVAGIALFFALGGSAIAVSHAKPQIRCQEGAVRGIAAVTGDPAKGIANVPDTFSSARSLFSHTFNCTGGATQVRRISVGVYEVRFAGNKAGIGLVSSGSAETTIQQVGNAFRIGLWVPGRADPIDTPFIVVAT